MNTITAPLIPNQLVFTDQAVHKAHEFMRKENNKNLKLRIFIVGFSCCGLQYGFAFDETINPEDIVIKKEIVSPETAETKSIDLLIDPISFLYLSEAKIDYSDTPDDARFVVHNPHVKTTCGCHQLDMQDKT